jgi:hypothetical protein
MESLIEDQRIEHLCLMGTIDLKKAARGGDDMQLE